jgi:multidrug efflux pump subunit AcrA (membrane-fusion protein)
VKVEVDPANANVEVKPGMTAEVRIRIGEYPDVLKLPTESVFEKEGKSYVFLVKADGDGKKKKKEKTEVAVGRRSSREVEVKSGVDEGQEYYAEAEIKDMNAKMD